MTNVTQLVVTRGLPKARPSPKSFLSHYLLSVHPARRHGATDCGEHLADGGTLSDADHLIQWLAERGVALVGKRP